LNAAQIRGLGPSAATLLYFLHPTLIPPCSTTIIKGFNVLMGANVRHGSWGEYLAMRAGILTLNTQYRRLLSRDLGAISALLFDIGNGRYLAPPLKDEAQARATWETSRARAQMEGIKMTSEMQPDDQTHTAIQGCLRDIGSAMRYAVYVARSDRNRPVSTGRLGDGCLSELPDFSDSIHARVIQTIDELWLDPATQRIVAAFEVEHTTSISLGMVRLLTLRFGLEPHHLQALFIVAPDHRENEVRKQLSCPAFRMQGIPKVLYLPYGELRRNRDAIASSGLGLRALQAVARDLS
jgi:type II restriction enzyme